MWLKENPDDSFMRHSWAIARSYKKEYFGMAIEEMLKEYELEDDQESVDMVNSIRGK